MSNEFVLTLSCADAPGIVHAVSGFLVEAGCNILDSQQFGDVQSDDGSGRFFMRVHFAAPDASTVATLDAGFAATADRFAMETRIHSLAVKPRLLLLVSKFGHCLNDLLFRAQSGQLDVEIVAVVSNHPDLGPLVERHDLPFRHLPLAIGAPAADKAAQEDRIGAIADAERVDLIVLARYMQIMSPAFCARFEGRAINIHHSFLPSFAGARPYHQAHRRGVKLIGATAHYVTADLDEGPIIEQGVERVDHAMDAEHFTAVGRDIESVVLARAVRWHVEHRILINGRKTVVFA